MKPFDNLTCFPCFCNNRLLVYQQVYKKDANKKQTQAAYEHAQLIQIHFLITYQGRTAPSPPDPEPELRKLTRINK
jgi:hypothetical protein